MNNRFSLCAYIIETSSKKFKNSSNFFVKKYNLLAINPFLSLRLASSHSSCPKKNQKKSNLYALIYLSIKSNLLIQ